MTTKAPPGGEPKEETRAADVATLDDQGEHEDDRGG